MLMMNNECTSVFLIILRFVKSSSACLSLHLSWLVFLTLQLWEDLSFSIYNFRTIFFNLFFPVDSRYKIGVIKFGNTLFISLFNGIHQCHPLSRPQNVQFWIEHSVKSSTFYRLSNSYLCLNKSKQCQQFVQRQLLIRLSHFSLVCLKFRVDFVWEVTITDSCSGKKFLRWVQQW